MNWYLGNNWFLLLLLLLPVLSWVLYKYLQWKSRRRDIFAQARFQEAIFEKRKTFARLFPLLYLLATLFLLLSIVDLLSGTEEIKTNQKVNNVVFMLDVSTSMDAQDVEPNRLTQAKNIIINTVSKLPNDKVGVVVFAGEATSIMPLTTDLTAVETYIGAIETSILKVQGTDFLAGMKTVVQKFKNIPKGARKVVIISDGEDNESNGKAAAKLASQEGIAVYSVGIGTDEGAPIPEYVFGQLMGYKTDMNGQTVISKRQTKVLDEMAKKTGGSAIDGNHLENATTQLVSELQKNISSTQTSVKSQNAVHYYSYFLVVSVVLFIIIFLFNPKRDFNI